MDAERRGGSDPHRRVKRARSTPSFSALSPASSAASRAAKGPSRKRDTKPEVLLRSALHAAGLRFRVDVADLPGRPDVVFPKARLVVFCDGDFWHGRDLEERLRSLESGHHAPYWVAKIRGKFARDRHTDATLAATGWTVMRFWETDLVKDTPCALNAVRERVRAYLDEESPRH